MRSNESEKKLKIRISNARLVSSKWLAVAFTGFVIYSMATFSIQEMKQYSLFLAFTLAVTFLRHPTYPKNPDSKLFLGIDIILVFLSFFIAIYIWVDYWEFIFRVGIPSRWDIYISIVAIILVFEATRRAVGWPILIIALAFLLYTLFGEYLPAPLSHKGYSIERITTTLFMTKNGIFGIPLRVMTQFIFLFIVFGVFFSACGGTQYFINIATVLFGKMRGGPAKISIGVSGMMGTISGSAVANTVTTGTFTIPLMKKIGFESHVAGAVEATASAGGALMPPVMGASAFVMAEFIGISYISVCKAALIPAILYYIAIFAIVHFYSLKIGIRGLSRREMPKVNKNIFHGCVYILPLLILVITLIHGYSPRIAVLYAILATIILTSIHKETRMGPARILQAMADSGYNSIMVACATVTAGIVIGIVLLTGMGTKITSFVLNISAGSLFLALPIVMLSCIVFGMGLPTLVCYVLLAATVAPSLVNLGITPLSVHLFIFYFGMLSMVTPPVSFASYAGAAIANSDPMKTGWVAWKFAFAGFLLPYMFVYDKSLLMMGSSLQISTAVLTSTIGVVCLGAGITGYLFSITRSYERFLLFLAAFLLIKPGMVTDLIGVLSATTVIALQLRKPRIEF
jgi:TRAP transporter 4TM/12TM fusion protein